LTLRIRYLTWRIDGLNSCFTHTQTYKPYITFINSVVGKRINTTESEIIPLNIQRVENATNNSGDINCISVLIIYELDVLKSVSEENYEFHAVDIYLQEQTIFSVDVQYLISHK